eukprot:500872-Prymnesium_polylepis.1
MRIPGAPALQSLPRGVPRIVAPAMMARKAKKRDRAVRVPPSTPEEIELARRGEYNYYPGSGVTANAPSSAPVPAPLMQLSIPVPDDVLPGESMEFQTPDGRVFSAVVPPGTPPGGSFLIEIEPAPATTQMPPPPMPPPSMPPPPMPPMQQLSIP